MFFLIPLIHSYKSLCKSFNETFSIPLCLVEDKNMYLFPNLSPELNYFKTIEPDSYLKYPHPFYFTTKDLLYFGVIPLPNRIDKVIIGPISSATCSTKAIREIISSLGINHLHHQEFISFFQSIPRYGYGSFLKLMSHIYFIFSGKEISIEDIRDINASKLDISIPNLLTNLSFNIKEEETFHNTLEYERLYLSCITEGNVEKLISILNDSSNLQAGSVAHDNLRQTKNIFISSITMATRAAIKGGLDSETAYQLSDISISEMEKLSNIESIALLELNTLKTLTEHVKISGIPKGISPIIKMCIDYVSNNINKNISVQSIASSLNLNRSYLSKTFKREVSISLSQYIRNKKLIEAKNLLLYSDKSINQISNYLCFSSQSYFQNVFKKEFNTTPRDFRLNFIE